MATKIIPGREGTATLISDHFGGGIGDAPTTPTRQEDPSRWHPVGIAEEKLLKRYGVTAEEFRTWRDRYGFPAPARNGARIKIGEWGFVPIKEWSEESVVEWEKGLRNVAAKLPR